MKTAAAVLLALVLAGCGSSAASSSPPADRPADTPAATSETPSSPEFTAVPSGCDSPAFDVLVREVTPTLPPETITLGYYPKGCPPNGQDTFDFTISTAPTGAGYCTQIALASDNPGYDTDATPAPALRKVLREAGPAC